MAVYKVIQDIEAEDKLVGFLTLKGFVYAVIAAVCAFIDFRLLITPGLGPLRWLLMLIFLVPLVLFGVLASPLGRDQPTEVWLLSRIQFLLKPRKRIWDQSGISELVTITAPKKVERQLTKDLSQSEVHSRLKALAMTLDSRGWAVKNVAVNLTPQSNLIQAQPKSDRLVDASSLPQDAPIVDINEADDILDEQNNPAAKQVEALMRRADASRKKGLSNKIGQRQDGAAATASDADFRFLDEQPIPAEYTKFVSSRFVKPGASDDSNPADSIRTAAEEDLLDRIELDEEVVRKGHPNFDARQQHAPKHRAAKSAPQKEPDLMTAATDTDKLNLAQNGNAFSVATVQNLANRKTQVKQIAPNEVEIDLH